MIAHKIFPDAIEAMKPSFECELFAFVRRDFVAAQVLSGPRGEEEQLRGEQTTGTLLALNNTNCGAHPVEEAHENATNSYDVITPKPTKK